MAGIGLSIDSGDVHAIAGMKRQMLSAIVRFQRGQNPDKLAVYLHTDDAATGGIERRYDLGGLCDTRIEQLGWFRRKVEDQ